MSFGIQHPKFQKTVAAWLSLFMRGARWYDFLHYLFPGLSDRKYVEKQFQPYSSEWPENIKITRGFRGDFLGCETANRQPVRSFRNIERDPSIKKKKIDKINWKHQARLDISLFMRENGWCDIPRPTYFWVERYFVPEDTVGTLQTQRTKLMIIITRQ